MSFRTLVLNSGPTWNPCWLNPVRASEAHSGTSYPRITGPPLDAANSTSLLPRPRQPIAPTRRGGPSLSNVQVGLGFPGESLPAEDAAEVDANLDRGDGAERQRGRGIAKVTSPISLQTVVSLKRCGS